MLFWPVMPTCLRRPTCAAAFVLAACFACVTGCKRSEPPADPLKTQREAMERAKDVGKTMQKAVDQEGRKADEDGR